MTVKIAIAGAAGRMGQQLVAQVAANPKAELSGAFDRTEGPGISADMAAAFAGADVVIDFTLPLATLDIMSAAKQAGAAYLMGTTGHDAAQKQAIQALGADMPVFTAANYSLGVNVLLGLVQQAAAALPADAFDLDILELHHNQKIDAPSGTALALGQAAAAGREQALDEVATYAREGETGKRPMGEIGFATLRGGDNPGEHTVMLVGAGERIELTHRAMDRSIFAKGAVTAACWLAGKPAGLYGMSDVLGL